MTKRNTANLLAFDRESSRRIDDDSRMHVSQSNISKAVVNPYLGSEIPGWQALGLDPQRIYQLLRDPAELEAAAPTFNNLPLMLKHVRQKADDPQTDIIVGSIGDVCYEHPYLKASMCIWDERGVAAVESEQMVELSSSYHYVPVMEPGEFEGAPYDGRMTNIRGNHLALVESGRAGSDVVVSDANPFTKKQEAPDMKTKLGIALLAALAAVAPKLAQDSALSDKVGAAKKKTFKRKEVVDALVAMDNDIEAEQLDNIIDAILGVEQDPMPQEPELPAEDEDDNGAPSKHAEIIDFLKSKGLDASDLEAVGNMLTRMDRPDGSDEDMDGYMNEAEVNTAMDAMRGDLVKQFQALEVAKSAVRPVVGDVIGMDSAASVYRFALDHLKVEHKDTPDAGLGNLFKVAATKDTVKTPAVAHDSALRSVSIPGLARFS